jgi:1-acyl-sn-glycerol-3-phosphate acyltransferase
MSSQPKPNVDYNRGTLQGPWRRIVRAILLAILYPLFRLKLEHLDRVPPEGPVLVISNHIHNADPLVVNAAFPRPIHFMAKKEAFHVPLLPVFMRLAGAFPVDRGNADRGAIKVAVETLAAGIPVGIYPEGTRSVTRSLAKAHSGAGLIALMSGVPVMPIVVTGTERLPFNGAKGRLASGAPAQNPGHKGVHVLFGELFTIPRTIDGRRVGSEQATEIMMIEIARLLPPDYRGIYADLLAQETVRRAIPVAPVPGR